MLLSLKKLLTNLSSCLKKKSKLLPLGVILLFSSCGRKNAHFFVFEKAKKTEKINKLSLPMPRNFKAVFKKNRTELTWTKPQENNLIGYNIYRFIETGFIRRKPINKKPITKESYIDLAPPHPACYLVRGIFHINNQSIEGPSSIIAKT